MLTMGFVRAYQKSRALTRGHDINKVRLNISARVRFQIVCFEVRVAAQTHGCMDMETRQSVVTASSQ